MARKHIQRQRFGVQQVVPAAEIVQRPRQIVGRVQVVKGPVIGEIGARIGLGPTSSGW